MRICDAKDCKTGRWTILMFIKVKIDSVKLLMIFIFLKISVKTKQHNFGDREHNFQKVA